MFFITEILPTVSVSSISVSQITTTKATVTWDRVTVFEFSHYSFTLISPAGIVAKYYQTSGSVTNPRVDITDLDPTTEYTIRIATAQGLKSSSNASKTFTTGERFSLRGHH